MLTVRVSDRELQGVDCYSIVYCMILPRLHNILNVHLCKEQPPKKRSNLYDVQ